MGEKYSSHECMKFIARFRDIQKNDFWQIIDAIGWITHNTDYQFICWMLNIHLKDDIDLQFLSASFSSYENRIFDRIEQYEYDNERLIQGDHKYQSDIVGSIIGLGETDYNHFMNTPLLYLEKMETENPEWHKPGFKFCFGGLIL